MLLPCMQRQVQKKSHPHQVGPCIMGILRLSIHHALFPLSVSASQKKCVKVDITTSYSTNKFIAPTLK